MIAILPMDLSEYIGRIDEFIRALKNELGDFVNNKAANDLAAMISNRVIQRGEDSEGRPFTPYSEVEIHWFKFTGKSRTDTAEKKVAKKTFLSYKEFRELNNLKTDKKNFEFSGEMWRKFGVIEYQKGDLGFRIKIGGETPEAQHKIDANSFTEAQSIIEPNKEEIEFINKNINRWLLEKAESILKT